MFTINSHWDTGKEQDVLTKSLFGNEVNLISIKKSEYNKESSNEKDVNKLKRKTTNSLGCKKKKGKYNIKKNGDVNDSGSDGKENYQSLSPTDTVMKDNGSKVTFTAKSSWESDNVNENIHLTNYVESKNMVSNGEVPIKDSESLSSKRASIREKECKRKKEVYVINNKSESVENVESKDKDDLIGENKELKKVKRKKKRKRKENKKENTEGVVEPLDCNVGVDKPCGNNDVDKNNKTNSSKSLDAESNGDDENKEKIKRKRKRKKGKEEIKQEEKVMIIEDGQDEHDDVETPKTNTLDDEINDKSESKKRKKKRKRKQTNTDTIGIEKNTVEKDNDTEDINNIKDSSHKKKNKNREDLGVNSDILDSKESPNLDLNILSSNEKDSEHLNDIKSKRKKKHKKTTVELANVKGQENNTSEPKISTGDVIMNNKNNEELGKLPPTPLETKFAAKYNKFQKKMMGKLKGGQFRWINEKLYSCKSYEAVHMFSEDPKLFDVYHDGFTSQVQQWPQNPVDTIIKYITERDSDLVVADFGCGDAKLSTNVPNKVHSFDLVAVNDHVTACDMKKVPLPNDCVDIAVFCLSLMGTNIVDFITEARRVTKEEGILKVAEVKSRFEDIDKFVEDVSSIGYTLIEKDESNKMFVLLEFQKTENVSSKKVPTITLKPCIYKRR